jgi:hypothetical protein
MPRPPGVQITRDRRNDGSVTFGLRVCAGGADERVPLGNSQDGWDEIRVETARRQLMAKIELGKLRIRQYRKRSHVKKEQIRKAAEAGTPLRDPRTGQRLRTLGNESINKTIGTLVMILDDADDAEDADWIERNIARNRRMREPREPKPVRGVLDVDEAACLLESADDLERQRHTPATLDRAAQVRSLGDDAELRWKDVAARARGCGIDRHLPLQLPR